MNMKTPFAATAFAVLAAPVFAGSAETPEPDPVISEPAPVVASSPDWTGFYAGGQIGYGDVDLSPGGSGDDIIGGIVGGYDHDLGNGWVIGGGLDYDFAEISVGAIDVEEVFRAKLRGGYKIGNGLIYGTGGYAWADTNVAGDDDGYFIGGGYEHFVTEKFTVGGEVLYHDFDNFTGTTDVEATTVQLRGTFRF